jgi:hypothetical protein
MGYFDGVDTQLHAHRPELAQRIDAASRDAQRRMAESAVQLAAKASPYIDLHAVFAALADGLYGDSPTRRRVLGYIREIEQRRMDMISGKAGRNVQTYEAAFRTLACCYKALDADPQLAALGAVHEAMHVTDFAVLRDVVFANHAGLTQAAI